MFQCPSCGGEMRFDIPSQKLKCGYCKTKIEPVEHPDIKGAEETEEFEVTKFLCSQCGAEIFSEDNTAAAFCSFCGSSTLLSSRISMEKRPDAIIPFKKTKEDCVAAYKKMMQRAIFAPDDYKDETCIDSFRGIYMPYWVYDVKHSGSFCLHGKKTSRRGDYDITKHYNLTGELDAEYNGITHDAAKEFADDISEGLAPYNVKKMLPFNPAYLAGFYADTHDVNSRAYDDDALEFARSTTLQALEKHPVYRGCQITVGKSKRYTPYDVTMEQPHYALFPVWFMSYQKNGRVGYVSINGQTGKISADIPVDYRKYTIGSLLLALPIFVLLNFIVSITAKTALITTLILVLIASLISFTELSKILDKDAGKFDKGKLRHDGKRRYARPKKISKEYKERFQAKKGIWGICSAAIAVIISVAILVLNPVSDYFYYGGAFLSIASILLLMVDIMRDYNVLATRKLPQFTRTGGDDRVKA